MDTKLYFRYGDNKLAYKCYGDPKHFPIIVHHGLIGSCDLPENWKEIATRSSIYLIAHERPGYGGSSLLELNSVSEWGKLLESFFEQLGIGCFGTIGVSAGAPYAYSLCHNFPEKTIGAWILSGVPYVVDKDIFSTYPEGYQKDYQHYISASAEKIAEEVEELMNNTKGGNSIPEYMKIAIECSSANNCLGVGREIKRQISDWGFDPRNLKTKINLWHAKEDEEVPYEPVAKMVKDMKNAQLNIQEDPSHFPSQQSIEELFASIKEIAKTKQ